MGVFAGPDVSESGLVLSLDAGNKKTFANSVINSTSWSLGSGSAPSYSQNGLTVENERVTGTDPFGRSATVWETRPSGDGNGDGGWNSSWFNIDNTKLYRFSVWVKRTSTTSGGTFYLGLYGNGTGIRRTDTSAYEGNPYWECSGTSKFDKDVWYLVVGHCYPYSTTYTGQHPESGIYTVAGGPTKVLSINACNIGTDVKWAGSDVTQTIHRCYHFYCGDNTTRLQLFDPRIDVIDGTEPSISNLLSGFTASGLSDLVGTNRGSFVNGPTYSSVNGGAVVFDGTDDYVNLGISSLLDNTLTGAKNWSISYWVKYTVDGRILDMGNIGGDPTGALELNTTSINVNNSATGSSLTASLTSSNWNFITLTKDSSRLHSWYLNGVFSNSSTTTADYSNGGGGHIWKIGRRAFAADSSVYQGSLSQLLIYNRVLTAAEIRQNFNANRGRFGI